MWKKKNNLKLKRHNESKQSKPVYTQCPVLYIAAALTLIKSVPRALSLTLRMRPEDVWVAVDVAGGSTGAWSSSGARGSDTPLLLSRGSPFSRASKLLPSAAPNVSRFKPSSTSAAHNKTSVMHAMTQHQDRKRRAYINNELNINRY